MPAYDLTINGKPYHVEVADPNASPLKVIVDGEAFEVQVAGEPILKSPLPAVVAVAPDQGVALPAAAIPSPHTNDAAVTAPMPGVILTLHVGPGQPVEPGQVLCVLEAMKMKNPIRSNRSGKVAEVLVREGQTVAYDDLLLRIA